MHPVKNVVAWRGRGLQVEYVDFRSRAARSVYIASRFKPLFQGRVLEVGCDQALLKQLLPGLDYVGVDIAGAPDMRLNLEQIERLPFDNASFDCVVCTETLEHLDNLHGIFGELLRVAKKYVIISLPNNWVNARVPIQRGKGSPSKYGLPADPPLDRHKWFFSLSDATDFIQQQRRRYAVSLRECYATEKPRPLLVRALRRMIYPAQMRYLNRYAHTLWVVLEKP